MDFWEILMFILLSLLEDDGEHPGPGSYEYLVNE